MFFLIQGQFLALQYYVTVFKVLLFHSADGVKREQPIR